MTNDQLSLKINNNNNLNMNAFDKLVHAEIFP
jgi:hypothetical protein